MDTSLWISVGVFFLGLFALLGIWQASIQRAVRKQTIDEITTARNGGTGLPLAQHPQIRTDLCIGCASCVRACPESEVLGIVDGVARIIHGARCIGHGRCADACPVAALTIGLGDVGDRADIPILSGRLESNVRGLYIAGELGGFALIRNAIEQGVKTMTNIVGRTRRARNQLPDDVLDVLIVGAGPAGFAASLQATADGLRYLTITQEDVGGTVRQYPRRKLTMTQPVDLPLLGRMRRHEYRKEELIKIWDQARKRFDLRIRSGVKFHSTAKRNGLFESETNAGTIRSRFLLLALGRRGTPRKLGVPGEESEKVFYRLIDASTYTNENILVVGGGDSAIEAATALANQHGNVVTLCYRKPSFFRLKARNENRIRDYAATGRVRLLFSTEVHRIDSATAVLSLGGEEPVTGEQIVNGNRLLQIPSEQVFVFAGGEPPFALLKKIGVSFGGEVEQKDPVETMRPAPEPVT